MNKKEIKAEIKETKDNIIVYTTMLKTAKQEIKTATKEIKELKNYLKDLMNDLKAVS